MKESFLQRAKADGEVLMKMMNFAGKVSKLKLEIRAKKQERERLIKAVGAQVFEIYKRDNVPGPHAFDEVTHNVEALKELDELISILDEQIAEAKARLKEGSQTSSETDSK